jgi:hypothetical protein
VEAVAGRGRHVADPLAGRSRVYSPFGRPLVKAPEATLELVGTRAEVERSARYLLRSLLPDSNPDDGVVVVGDGAGTWILCARAYEYEGRKVWAGVLTLISRKGEGE